MPLYIFSSQIPELKHLPSEEREEIIEVAVFSLPITLWRLLTVLVSVLPITAVALALSFTFGRWAAVACLPIGGFILWVVFLNLAQGEMRKLVKAKRDQKG